MTVRHIKGQDVKEFGFSQTTLFINIYDKQLNSGACTLIDEFEIEDLAGSGGEAEVDCRDAYNALDLRDLLLDDTD